MGSQDTFSLAMGESGEGPGTPEELRERLRVLEEKIKRDARDVIEVLRTDFPKFVERVVRDRFEDSRSEVADRMSEREVAALKKDVAEAGRKAIDEIIPSLEDWKIWLELPAAAPGQAERRDLAGNAEVQSRLQRIAGFVREVLERHGFPVSGEDFSYRLPSWFIQGRLVVSLVEAYWRNMEEYQGVKAALKALGEGEQRKKRRDKWDKA